jgi:hypothetical protein
MFCNQYHSNYLNNKLWAEMFQTSLISLLCYPHLLSMSSMMNVTDIYHLHDCDLNSIKTWSPFSLFSHHTHPCTIYLRSRHTPLVILQRLLSSTSIFSGVIASCYFWYVIYFSSLKSLSSESRDEILFRGEGCDSSCICNARHIFC